MKLLLILLILWLQGSFHEALTHVQPSEKYTHVLNVIENDPNQYVLFWKLTNPDEIQFEVHCKTTGWVGFGISPNGGMAGADIAIGWVDEDSKGYLKDCHAANKSTPLIDKSQDWELLEAGKQDGYTMLKYKRKLVTCDIEDDVAINQGNNILIFAWNDEKIATGKNSWRYHGTTNRMQKAVLLLSYRNETIDEQEILPKDTFVHSYRMNNVKLPAKRDFYFCDLYELPVFDTKTHLVQFEMVVNPKNIRNVHHLLIYECQPDFVKTEPLARECGPLGLPYLVARKCSSRLFIAWTLGGAANYTFPKQAGYPFQPANKTRYLLFEMHYDNPMHRSDIVDDSGINMYFTQKELRQHDLGLLLLGDDGFPLNLQIPPGADSFEYSSICHPQCSQIFFPDDGISVVAGLLHAHMAARGVRTSLVRKDILTHYLVDNQNYDFNFQFIQDIEPIKIYKGDSLITTCKYNTRDRSNFTYFGFGATQEMCYDWLYYYPKIENFTHCVSEMPPKVIYDFYRNLMSENLLPKVKLNESTYHKDTYIIEDYLNNANITPRLVAEFTEFFKSDYNKTYVCGETSLEGPVSTYITIDNQEGYKPSKVELSTPQLICPAKF